MFADYPVRFFKSSFPGIFQAENCWSQDEYFAVHDLTTPNAVNNHNNTRIQKSFDFRFPLEATTSNINNNINLQLFSQLNNNGSSNNQHIEGFPTSSTVNTVKPSQTKKKRKRPAQQPSATITSQELLVQQQQQQINLPLHAYQISTHNEQQYISNASDPEGLLAGPSTATATPSTESNIQQPRPKLRKKIYQCSHCSMQYIKLKDRNSHMILQHNYVRRNRRLILAQNISSDGAETNSVNNVHVTSTHSQTFLHDTAAAVSASDYVEDSKHDIVKIEMTELQIGNDASMILAANSVQVTSDTAQPDEPLLNAKCEFIDDKELVLVNESGADLNETKKVEKPRILPLAATTPATKLASLYRMLVSFNMDKLRRNKTLSEWEDKAMKSSIFFCYVCRCSFTSVKLYDAHLTEHPAECFTCSKTFHRWKNFSLHLKRHLGWKEFGCSYCDKKFVVRSALVEHTRMHTGQTPLKCKACGMCILF